jgi:tetratricopeptide (TPR) repeat protein
MLALKTVGRRGEYLEALSRFEGDFPGDSRSHSLRGREYAASGALEEAVASFRRAVELDPESPHNHNNLATALAGLDRYEEAGREFEIVCQSDPGLQNAAYFAAASFSMAGMPADAARWAKVCIDEGFAPAQKFVTDPLFANLRSSEHWDAATSRPR